MVDERKVPEGWVVKKLKDLSTMKSGNSITSKKINDYDKIPCYGGNGLRGYTYDYTHEGEYALIGRQGALCGNVQFVSGVFFASEHAIVVTPNDETDIKWFFYMLTDMGLNKYSESSAQPGLSVIKILNLELVAPADRIEQKFIAEALSDTDNLIQSLENLIDKKKKIKQGAMQQLLTGKKRLPGFSGEWEVKKLGEIGEFSGAGIDKKINADEEKVRLLNFLDVYHKDFIYSNDLWHEVTAPKYKAEKCSIKRGDVFFTPSSELRTDIALSAVAMEDIDDAVYSYHVIRYRFYDEWDIQFKTYIFNTRFFFSQAETMCEGSGKRYVISLKKFKELEIMYPTDLREQRAIAQVLSDMDAEIEALEEKLEKYKTIKQGMMQELLTGRIRLI